MALTLLPCALPSSANRRAADPRFWEAQPRSGKRPHFKGGHTVVVPPRKMQMPFQPRAGRRRGDRGDRGDRRWVSHKEERGGVSAGGTQLMAAGQLPVRCAAPRLSGQRNRRWSRCVSTPPPPPRCHHVRRSARRNWGQMKAGSCVPPRAPPGCQTGLTNMLAQRQN